MKNCQKSVLPFILLSLIFNPTVASAYVGPGLGTGVVAAVLGVAVGIVMLVVGVVWYPIKRLFRRMWFKG
jgi:hypothetical protein